MLGRSSLMVLLVLFLLLVLASSCQPAEPEIVEVEVTRIVEMEVEPETVEVEVTRIVEVTPEPAEAAEAPNIFPSMTAEVRTYEAEANGRDYVAFVALPMSYGMGDQAYPAVYVTDGDFYTLPTAMAASQVAFGGEMPEVITVGIGYGGPAMDTLERRDLDLIEEQEAFLRFLVEELIPDIEANYQVDTAVRTLVGHSSGGDFSMYALSHAPETFRQIIASSPSCGGDCVEEVNVYAAEHGDQPVRLFASTAELDEELMPVFEDLTEALQANEYGGLASELEVLGGETHLSARPRAFVSGLRWIFSGAEPTVDLTENITYQEEDIVGTWIGEMPLWDMVVRLYFKEDGYTRAVAEGGATTELDKYYFEGDHLTIESNACDVGNYSETIKPCTATYIVYVLKNGDSVVGLRFEVIQDQYLARKEAMTKAKWQPFAN